MAEWIRYLKKIFMLVILFPLRVFPIKKNRVLLNNDLAKKYSDNPKAVAEYLLSEYPGVFQVVYAIQDVGQTPELKKRGLLPVRHHSLLYFYYAMTAQVFLTNSGGFSYLPLRKSQYVINTWHGGGAYKKDGIYMYGDTWLFRRDLKMSAKKTNVFLSTSELFSEVTSGSMLIPRSVFWEIGMPRNDKLINNDANLRCAIRKKIGLAEDEKLVLFAPTYRKPEDNYYKSSIGIDYGIDSDRVCSALSKRFGGKWKFSFRLHPLAESSGWQPKGSINLTNYEDMQDLLLVADVMINDFSSSLWDFMLTGRPCFVFAVDLQHYIETTEVYTPVTEWPFPKATNNDELEKCILEFDEEKYAADCKCHYETLGGCETGHAAKMVCDRIYEICLGVKPGENDNIDKTAV